MNKNRLMASGSLIMAGAFVALSVSGWVGASAEASPPPSPTATVEPVSAYIVNASEDSPAPAPECQEDEPCWNCLEMGNKLCGVDPANLPDAWASFDGVAVAEVVGQSVSFGAAYIGTTGASSLDGYWVVPSMQYGNTFHVFAISVGS